MVTLWNVRHVTMLYELALPDSDCRFVRHPVDEHFWSYEAFKMNFVYPYALYFVWGILYYIFNFVCKAEKIKE